MVNQNTHIGPSFSLKNRISRLIWALAYFLFFRFSPRPFHGWRRFVLRLFGAKIGKNVHVYPGVIIWAPWNLTVDDHAGIASKAILYSQGSIYIGKYAVISQGAHLCGGTHDYSIAGFPLIAKPIIVEDFAWVAAEVFIHPGVRIEEGAVIGARSVVSGDMPAWQVSVGFPCKPVKARMSDNDIVKFKNSMIH